MATQFYVGDQVRHINTNNKHEPLNNQVGTVTHLHGEPGYKATRSEVWVRWNASSIPDCWVNTSFLRKV